MEESVVEGIVRDLGLGEIPGIVVILLTGSASENSPADAEIDLIVVTSAKQWSRRKGTVEAAQVDLFLHGIEKIRDEICNGTTDSIVNMYAEATFLRGDRRISEELVRLAQMRLLQKRPLSDTERAAYLEKSESFVRKALRSTDPTELRFLCAVLAVTLTQGAIHFRGGWIPGPDRALRLLQMMSPDAHRSIAALLAAPSRDVIAAAVSRCLRNS
ncbi:MAG: hypothetical protein WCC70_04555 [Candidatus Aquilonibacter sp.]